MPLHARDMVPPVRELIEELHSEIIEIPTEDVYERDAATGVLIRVGTTPGGFQVVTSPTGKLVESFQTTEDGVTWVTHEGSMKQADLLCGDCGSLLKPANDRDFYYLLCTRLNERRHEQFQVTEERDVEIEEGRRGRRTFLLTWNLESDKPYKNCVIECGNEPNGDPDSTVEAN